MKNVSFDLDIQDPKTFITDKDDGLIRAITTLYPTADRLLCLWHINNNITTQCKSSFSSNESWEAFYQLWKTVVFAETEAEYYTLWARMRATYSQDGRFDDYDHSNLIQYINTTWIRDHKERFVKCFTNRYLHFSTVTTSRAESSNSRLKRALQSSTGDLMTVIHTVETVIMNQYRNYQTDMEVAKVRVPLQCQQNVFRDLIPWVTPFALTQICEQWNRIRSLQEGQLLPLCTRKFTTTVGLPCAHTIQLRLLELPNRSGAIRLGDIHDHWLFERPHVPRGLLPPQIPSIHPPPDSLLLIQNPPAARPRGRPAGAIEDLTERQRRRQQAQANTTQREPLQVELAERNIQLRRGRGGRGRGGRRGGNARAPLHEYSQLPVEDAYSEGPDEQLQHELQAEIAREEHIGRANPGRSARRTQGWVRELIRGRS